MTTPYTDIGNAVASSMLDRLSDALTEITLAEPGWVGQVGGSGPPTVDACNGVLWVRVATMFPTDGTGAQLTTTRFASEIPAWVVSLEMGVLWCHPVIEPDGSSPDMEDWEACAVRDGQYRLVLMQAAREFYPAAQTPLKPALLGATITPWAPIGPEGGYSGGLVVVNSIVGALALC